MPDNWFSFVAVKVVYFARIKLYSFFFISFCRLSDRYKKGLVFITTPSPILTLLPEIDSTCTLHN